MATDTTDVTDVTDSVCHSERSEESKFIIVSNKNYKPKLNSNDKGN